MLSNFDKRETIFQCANKRVSSYGMSPLLWKLARTAVQEGSSLNGAWKHFFESRVLLFDLNSNPHKKLDPEYIDLIEFDGPFLSVRHCYEVNRHTDPDVIAEIRRAVVGSMAKKISAGHPESFAHDWNKEKEMYWILRERFRSPAYRKLLLQTKTKTLVYHNLDNFWGCGPVGEGKNVIGKLLTQARKEIR